jgi:hypothetical protein
MISIMSWHVRSFSCHCFIVCSSSRLVASFLSQRTQRGVQSIGLIFVRRDLNIELREIHRKTLPQKSCTILAAQNDVRLVIRDGASARLAAKGLCFVIPANPGSRSGMTVSDTQIRQKF